MTPHRPPIRFLREAQAGGIAAKKRDSRTWRDYRNELDPMPAKIVGTFCLGSGFFLRMRPLIGA
jgi:hypothetical protein